MNFVAAWLLTRLPEADAYWLLYTLMVSGRYRLRALFVKGAACSQAAAGPPLTGLAGLPFLKVCQYQFQRLFEFFLPKLSERFNRSLHGAPCRSVGVTKSVCVSCVLCSG